MQEASIDKLAKYLKSALYVKPKISTAYHSLGGESLGSIKSLLLKFCDLKQTIVRLRYKKYS